jgi:protein-S-isoprenylcysteine O-methyltransferase Ste14
MSPIEKSSERARLSRREVVLDIGPWYLERGLASRGSSRNDVCAAAQSKMLNVGFAMGTWWCFVVIVPVVFFILHRGVILREERYLERKFGESYARYKSTVRRYL